MAATQFDDLLAVAQEIEKEAELIDDDRWGYMIGVGLMDKLREAVQLAEFGPTFVVTAHYPGGGSEPWDVVDTKEKALACARTGLSKYPVTECGTGGVKWMEITGTGIAESIGVERTADGSPIVTSE